MNDASIIKNQVDDKINDKQTTSVVSDENLDGVSGGGIEICLTCQNCKTEIEFYTSVVPCPNCGYKQGPFFTFL